jgi:hypothetical protein
MYLYYWGARGTRQVFASADGVNGAIAKVQEYGLGVAEAVAIDSNGLQPRGYDGRY